MRRTRAGGGQHHARVHALPRHAAKVRSHDRARQLRGPLAPVGHAHERGPLKDGVACSGRVGMGALRRRAAEPPSRCRNRRPHASLATVGPTGQSARGPGGPIGEKARRFRGSPDAANRTQHPAADRVIATGAFSQRGRRNGPATGLFFTTTSTGNYPEHAGISPHF